MLHWREKPPSGDDIFNGLSALVDDRFNDFESISQEETDDPLEVASADLQDAIARELEKFALPDDWELTPQHILARASALSCGGCNNLAVADPIAPGPAEEMGWPATAGFVHITETGELSPALTQHFLPARCEALQEFLEQNEQEPEAPAASAAAEPEVSKARETFNEVQA